MCSLWEHAHISNSLSYTYLELVYFPECAKLQKTPVKNELRHKNNHNLKMETTEATPDQQCERLLCGSINAKPFEGVIPNTMGSSHVFPKPLGEGLGDDVPSDL